MSQDLLLANQPVIGLIFLCIHVSKCS